MVFGRLLQLLLASFEASVSFPSIIIYLKDFADRKILPIELFKSSVYYSSFTWSKIYGKNLQLPMKNIPCSLRLLIIKDNSHTNLRSSHPQLSGKDGQYREEDSENKILP